MLVSLLDTYHYHFSLEKHWKVKVPPWFAFFSWTAALGKILTIDNLRHQRLILLDWCCICKRVGESVDHLLLHCSLACELWSMVFGLLGVQWVLPRSVMDLLARWQRQFGRHRHRAVWRMVPHCVMWCICMSGCQR